MGLFSQRQVGDGVRWLAGSNGGTSVPLELNVDPSLAS